MKQTSLVALYVFDFEPAGIRSWISGVQFSESMETSVPSHSNALKRDTSTFFEMSSLVLHKKEKKRKEKKKVVWNWYFIWYYFSISFSLY